MRRAATVAGLVCGGAILAFACGKVPGAGTDTDGGGEAGATGSAGGSGGSGPLPDASSGGTGGSVGGIDAGKPDAGDGAVESGSDAAADALPDVSFVYDGGSGEEDACAATVVSAQNTQLAMYILLDRSGSMTFSNKWSTAISAITQFVNDPAASGMKVALQYFPLDQGHACTGGGYATPAVSMGLLPGHATAITSSLNAEVPSGTFTPLEGALNGISQFGKAYAAAPPGTSEKVVGLLLTDGLPDGPCDNTAQKLTTIASAAYGGSPSVPIYVMGMSGADFTLLGQIAAAGGTGAAYSVTSGGASAFVATLKDIQFHAVGCEYVLPVPEAGLLDPNKISVIYTSGGGAPQNLVHQPGVSTCGNGWYFDDALKPKLVRLCPSTCNLVNGDANAKLAINLGCLGS